MKKKAATYHEIARRAGVSIGTVDRVLNKRGRVAPNTEKRVQQAVKDLNYTKNIIASTLKRGKRYVFGVVIPRETDEAAFWKLPADGIRAAEMELERYQVHTVFYPYVLLSEQSFLNQTKKALEDGIDGLIIVPSGVMHPEIILPHLETACPFTFLDSDIPGAAPVSYVGQHAYDSGFLAGRLMQLFSQSAQTGKTDPVYLTWSTISGSSNIQGRLRGFTSFFTDAKFIHESFNPKSSLFSLQDRAVEIIRRHPEISGIFVSNCFVFPFAEALTKLNNQGRRIPVIGYDLIAENITSLKNGAISCIINQRPFEQGYSSVFTLFRYIVLQQPSSTSIYMPIDIVTKENADYYIQHTKTLPQSFIPA